MKTFIKISEDVIVNVRNVIKIIKATIEVNDKLKYVIKYYTTDLINITQYFVSKEERDLFFNNVCSDLMY